SGLHIGAIATRRSPTASVCTGVPWAVSAWGTMVEAYERLLLTRPWPVRAPGAAIFITVLAFSLFGDGLRDILDPRSRRTLVQAVAATTLPGQVAGAAEA